jgi:hypothetical protein
VNGNVETTAHNHTARIARVAWFCAFVLPLILAALLLGVKSAQAAPPEAEAAPLAFEEEFELEEEDEGEFAEEECETAEEEFEASELTKAEADTICKEAREAAREAAGSSAAGECPIHSATAHSSVHNDRLRLTIGYTTNTPIAATIELRGPVKDSFKRHLGKSGVLRFSKTLRGAPHGRTVVRIKLPASERAGCPSRRLVLHAG